ncbi:MULTISPECIES: hypothetical protein [unclassified Streptomyces]|uniref:hypothetical protein n=1 Tax=unclassified Streptomyces TaxID=2593676 RepID=UPI002DD8D35C|nr:MULTISPECIES: hypothetical protein [unclassified Streptomyces]WSA97544.1 hypothetical protein OIE63_34525 [Streptomyces sp. NBC_01795]WSB81971.1 hypothetical protein OHB04_35630 [Streptomyces sp. NBC_01775]WSS17923.1 hypothetical protein OG533_04625 [Streptomyces sp. NBC_01186]WSS46670.1 hypothetical protein OG220_04730 [Streptomyces sp. NBC_01187]
MTTMTLPEYATHNGDFSDLDLDVQFASTALDPSGFGTANDAPTFLTPCEVSTGCPLA